MAYRYPLQRIGLSILLLAGATIARASDASAFTLNTLYSFCSKNGCSDGVGPQSQWLSDQAGHYFGAAAFGGVGAGTVWKFAYNPRKMKWGYTRLYAFCIASGCGQHPRRDLILDQGGNLYGMMNSGGAGNAGEIFELLKPPPGSNKWKLRVLHDFCARRNCTDGSDPSAGLSYVGQATGALYDGVSPLYGSTFLGGKQNAGLIYQLNPPPPGQTRWTEQAIFDFCSQSNCADGGYSEGELIADAAGTLYGTTGAGGQYGSGTVFTLKPGTPWQHTILYSFCKDGLPCTDGESPHAPLVMDASGNLFGATRDGGDSNSYGVIFKLTRDGDSYDYSLLHAFQLSDGHTSYQGLILDAQGNLFGVTPSGGAQNAGTVYQLAPDGTFTVLHAFCQLSNCTDGNSPAGAIVLDESGNLFGSTREGGAHNFGTLFELVH